MGARNSGENNLAQLVMKSSKMEFPHETHTRGIPKLVRSPWLCIQSE